MSDDVVADRVQADRIRALVVEVNRQTAVAAEMGLVVTFAVDIERWDKIKAEPVTMLTVKVSRTL